MRNRLSSSYDFHELRPLMWMSSGLAILTFIAGALVHIAGFLWFCLVGGIVIFIASFFLDRVIAVLSGGPSLPKSESGPPGANVGSRPEGR